MEVEREVMRRTGKVRQSETDILPLCHATNPYSNVGVLLTNCSLACLYVSLSRYLYSSINCHCCVSHCDISQQCSKHTSTPKYLCCPSLEFCALLRSSISCHFKHCIVNCIVRNMARIMFCSVLFFSRRRSEGWPHYADVFSQFISVLCHSD